MQHVETRGSQNACSICSHFARDVIGGTFAHCAKVPEQSRRAEPRLTRPFIPAYGLVSTVQWPVLQNERKLTVSVVL